jgi:hypothetical protein
MKFFHGKKLRIFLQWGALAILVGILALTLYYFVSNLETLRSRGYISGHIRRQPRAQEISPEQIRGWMTFRYINLVFNMPPAYLQSALNIKDSRYPNLSLDSLARQQKISSAELVGKTAGAVKSFHP